MVAASYLLTVALHQRESVGERKMKGERVRERRAASERRERKMLSNF